MTWKQVLPELARLDDPATHELFSQAQEVFLPANTIVFHQELATELGSAREVISRQLKDLEGRGLVQLQRGCIDLQDVDGLKNLATQ